MPTHFRARRGNACRACRLALAILAGICSERDLADAELLLVFLRAMNPKVYGPAYDELQIATGDYNAEEEF